MVMPMNFYGMGMGTGMGMNTQNSSGNVYADLKAKYGCGYADYYDRPRVGPYPFYAIPQADPKPSERTWLGRVIKKLYS